VTVLKRYCTVCREPIPLRRITRGSFYCSAACRDKAKKEMRQFKAEKECRLCGRPPLKPKQPRKGSNGRPVELKSALIRQLRTLGLLNRKLMEVLERVENQSAGLCEGSLLPDDDQSPNVKASRAASKTIQ
jgi:RNA polymerase-binding transcription factor DksA